MLINSHLESVTNRAIDQLTSTPMRINHTNSAGIGALCVWRFQRRLFAGFSFNFSYFRQIDGEQCPRSSPLSFVSDFFGFVFFSHEIKLSLVRNDRLIPVDGGHIFSHKIERYRTVWALQSLFFICSCSGVSCETLKLNPADSPQTAGKMVILLGRFTFTVFSQYPTVCRALSL